MCVNSVWGWKKLAGACRCVRFVSGGCHACFWHGEQGVLELDFFLLIIFRVVKARVRVRVRVRVRADLWLRGQE